MTGFSNLVLGSLHVKSYDWVGAAAGCSTTLTRRLAKLMVDADLHAPCSTLALFPESAGNIHRFAAATSCYNLDE
nr:unnamed protein product [Digitaria exilis]